LEASSRRGGGEYQDIIHRVFLLFGEEGEDAPVVETDWQEVVFGGRDMTGWKDGNTLCVLEWGGMFVG